MNPTPEEDFSLLYAIDSGDPATVAACIHAKPNLLADFNIAGSNCLHHAVELGNIGVVQALLEIAGTRSLLNQFDDLSNTPLIVAVSQGHYEIAKLLIGSGADVNAHEEAKIGNTAIREAAETGSPQLVELLLSAGADPKIPGWMQLTAVHKAQERYEKDRSPENAAVLRLIEKAVRR